MKSILAVELVFGSLINCFYLIFVFKCFKISLRNRQPKAFIFSSNSCFRPCGSLYKGMSFVADCASVSITCG